MIRFSKLDTIMVCSEEIWLSELIFVIFLGLEQFLGISSFYEIHIIVHLQKFTIFHQVELLI